MIEATNNKVNYRITDGTNTRYPFPYPFFKTKDLDVYLAADEDGKGNWHLVEGEDYRIEQKEDYSQGAEVELLLTGELEGKYLTIMRILPIVQETNLPVNGKLPSDALEMQLDKIVMVQQQMQEELDRSVKLSVHSSEDPTNYLADLEKVTTNAKDVALHAADAAAQSALTCSVSERNISLIWAELTGDPTLAENALLTVKEAAEASGAIKAAKEIAIGEINTIGATAIAATEKAANEAAEAAKVATDSAGSITGKVDDAIAIQVSQAAGATGVLGAAIAGGVADVEAARQEAIEKANNTLQTIIKKGNEFESSKNAGLIEITNKVSGVALDVQTAIERAQLIANEYLKDAQATVSGSVDDLNKMLQDATAAGDTDLVAAINKRIAELNTLSGYLTNAEKAADAAESFKEIVESLKNDTTGIKNATELLKTQTSQLKDAANTAYQNALNAASDAGGNALAALNSAQDAALAASNARAAELAAGAAAGEAATTAAEKSITAHNANSNAHSSLFESKLSITGGEMLGPIKFIGYSQQIILDKSYCRFDIVASQDYFGAGWLSIFGKDYFDLRAGGFELGASGDNRFQGKPDGSLTWMNKNIVRSVDGVNADNAGNVAINALPKTGGTMSGALSFAQYGEIKAANNGYIMLMSGANYNTSPHILLRGAGTAATANEVPGEVFIIANDGNKQAKMVLRPDGEVTLNGKPFGYNVEYDEEIYEEDFHGAKANIWYRKYPDGWVEQGGTIVGGNRQDRIINFPIEFRDQNYTIVSSQGDDHDGDYVTFTIGSKFTVSFSCIQAGEIASWYACGWAKY